MASNKNTRNRKVERTRDRAELLEDRRKKRSDLGSYRSIMSTPEGSEYDHLWFRWVNNVNEGRRMAYFLNLGWKVWQESNVPVGDEDGATRNNVSVGTGGEVIAFKSDGTKAILMYIDKDIWDADQEIKAEKVKARNESIYDQASERGLEKRPV